MVKGTLENKRLVIIGSGHIAQALVSGLVQRGVILPENITVSNPSGSKLRMLKQRFGVNISRSNIASVLKADWIFLAVKPFVVKDVLKELNVYIVGKVIISLAAGVTLEQLNSYAPDSRPKFIRMMPNIAIAHHEGVVGIFAPDSLGGDEKRIFIEAMKTLGCVVEVKREEAIDALTLISGCGPAIALRLIEIYIHSGVRAGLSSAVVRQCVLQTFAGTLTHLEESSESPSKLIQTIATKGGVSETILNKLKREGFDEIFQRAMGAGGSKIKALQKSITAKSHPQG